MAGWLALLFQEGNDAWCFQSPSVCVCVSVLTRVRVSGFYVNTGRGLHAGVHIKEDEGEKEGEIE